MRITQKYFGLTEYPQSLHLQQEAMTTVKGTDKLILLGFEYHSAITLGRRGDAEHDLLNVKPDSQIYNIERGGQATLHNRGQLVIYPIFDLRANSLGVRDFILKLNSAQERVMDQLGISAKYNECEGGLFTAKGKISFTGLRIESGISSHGLSVNINNDLGAFAQIRPCGKVEASMDRVKDYGVEIELEKYFNIFGSQLS